MPGRRHRPLGASGAVLRQPVRSLTGIALALAVVLVSLTNPVAGQGATGHDPAALAPRVDHVGTYVWHIDAPDFGGFSGLDLREDGSRFTALSDRATLRWGRILRDAQGRIEGVEATGHARLKDSEGRKLAIICSKGSLDMAYPGLILANAALGEGVETHLFFTFWGFDMINKATMGDLKFSFVGNTAMHPPGHSGMGIHHMLGALPGATAAATARSWAESAGSGSVPASSSSSSSATAGSGPPVNAPGRPSARASTSGCPATSGPPAGTRVSRAGTGPSVVPGDGW